MCEITMSENIRWNIEILQNMFSKSKDVVQKSFYLTTRNSDKEKQKIEFYVIYIDGLVNNEMVEETILKPLLEKEIDESVVRKNSLQNGLQENESEEKNMNLWEFILYEKAQTVDISEQTNFEEVITSVLRGDTAIFIDGYAKAMVVSTKKLPLRGISASDKESTMRGPRDSFNEGLRQSTALIRRRIRDEKLVCEQGTIGQRSKTDYAIMYLSDVAKTSLVEEIKDRFERYEIDAIFDSGMAEHLLEDNWYSPFPMFQATTRPDKVAAGIVEGRVAIVFDNSPEVILAPCNFNMLLQASDDYYNRWTVGTFARVLRYLACVLAVCLPGLYVAVTEYHSEMLPTGLLYAIACARSRVTFPVIVEILIMEFLFELLREAGIRLPGPLGNTIGVVGGLIVGQSAVEAGIVSTMAVIVVALTAIASFAIPNEEFASVFRLLKFFVLITSAFMGLYGFILGLLVLAIHLADLKSFGVPYMLPAVGVYEREELLDGINGNQKVHNKGCGNQEENQDFILRSPIKKMRYRPMWARGENKIRLRRK